MPDIFLSYSREDQATAHLFAEGLKREGFGVWWDQTLATGEAYDEVTEQALREAKAVVVLWSRASTVSRWVRAEATIADRNGTLVPAMIEECTRPVMFELRQTADLSKWRGDSADASWRTFVVDTRRITGRQTSAAAPQPATVAAAPLLPGATRRRPVAFALVAAALLAIAGTAWYFLRDNGGTAAATGVAAKPVSIAVLPFVNFSGDPEQEYFSDGLTEEILNELAKNSGLQVIGRTSSFSFKGTNADLRTIAGKLNVANLLEGSVRRDGKNLRITAQLIDGSSGGHRWSRTYDGELNDVFALQSKVAADVAEALSVTLDVGAMRQAEGGTTNFEAYDRLLQMRQLALQGDPAKRARILELAHESVRLDDRFSFGWYRLANALPPGAGRDAARKKVWELTPDSWFANALRFGDLFGQRPWNWTELEKLAQSILGPGEPITAFTLDRGGVVYQFLMQVGRMQETVRLMQRVAEVEPQLLGNGANLQLGLYVVGNLELAERQYQRNLALPGNHFYPHLYKLLSLLRSPRPDVTAIDAQFRTLLEGVRQNTGPGLFRELARIHQDRPAVLALLEKYSAETDGKRRVGLDIFAMVADAYGERGQALKALRQLTIEGQGAAGFLWWAPYSTELRADPRFKDIVRELGLVDYWRKSNNWGDFCRPVGADDFTCH